MSANQLHEDVDAFDEFLGNPLQDGPFSFRTAVEFDEAEQRPDEQLLKLSTWGLFEHYIPANLGGKLHSLEQLSLLSRSLARRNLSVSIGHSITMLGCVHVWASGSSEQQQRLAATVRSGGSVALAYNERDHGSDFLASGVTLRRTPDGRRIKGEKWLVNAATECKALTLFVNSEDRRSYPEGSILLLFKDDLDQNSFHHLPSVRTLGVRGVDFSGIAFDDCAVPPGSLVGPEGAGLMQTLKAFQVTRTLIPSMSIGALQAAIELVLSFAAGRNLYGRSILALPNVRGILADAFADLITLDVVQRAVARSAHVWPESLRLWSAVSKYVIPAVVDDALRSLGDVLGARSYLREEHPYGMFQKIVRDHAVIKIFHGGAFQLLQTVGLFRTPPDSTPPHHELRSVFRSDVDLPEFDWGCLSPISGTCRYPAQLVELLLASAGSNAFEGQQCGSAFARVASEQTKVVALLRTKRREQPLNAGGGLPQRFYELTRLECFAHAAGIAAAAGLLRKGSDDAESGYSATLLLGLDRLLDRALPSRITERSYSHVDAVFGELDRCWRDGCLLPH